MRTSLPPAPSAGLLPAPRAAPHNTRRNLRHNVRACVCLPSDSALDVAATTLSLLRAELPYPSSARARAVISERVNYSFINGLHECSGRDAYVNLQAFWRTSVPGARELCASRRAGTPDSRTHRQLVLLAV